MTQTALAILDRSQIGEARRQAVRLAEAAGFQAVAVGRVAIVVSELATNVYRHGNGGEVLVEAGAGGVFETIAIDRGPGMAALERCLEDGFSTGGTAGTGFGAVLRQSDDFDAWSVPGQGTVVVSRITEARAPETRLLTCGAISVPKPGETVCGDAWSVSQRDGEAAFLVVDGLGHGPAAGAAAAEAVQAFTADPFAGPEAVIGTAHARMSGTRGGVIAVAHLAIDRETTGAGRLRYLGVGNIAGSLVTGAGSQGMMSQNGIAGGVGGLAGGPGGMAGHRTLRTLEFPWPEQGCLVMHSDGLQTRWRIDRYPGLARRHPAVIAGVLYRDFNRGNDDVTILVATRSPPRTPGRRPWA